MIRQRHPSSHQQHRSAPILMIWTFQLQPLWVFTPPPRAAMYHRRCHIHMHEMPKRASFDLLLVLQQTSSFAWPYPWGSIGHICSVNSVCLCMVPMPRLMRYSIASSAALTSVHGSKADPVIEPLSSMNFSLSFLAPARRIGPRRATSPGKPRTFTRRHRPAGACAPSLDP